MASIKTTEHTVQLDGYHVHYQKVGAGEPIVLVHGLSGSSRWWVRNIAALARYYTVYLVDLPGFGTMRRSHGRLVLRDSTTWLLQWLEAVGIKRARFVGHSMGGYICLLLAAQHPEIVQCLVLVSPAGVPRIRSILGYLIPLLVSIRYLTPGFLLILTYDALRAGPITLLRAAQDLLTQDVRDVLPNIVVPTLLVWGENDTLVPPSLADILRREIAHSRLLILRRAAHVSMYDRPKEFNEAILAFLQGKEVGR